MTSTLRLATATALLAACVPALPAQAVPAPATELARLKPLEGHWEGTGTVVMDPAAAPVKWNSKTTAQWVLGGHFLQEDTYITFEGNQPPLAFQEYLGWDREQKRYVNLAISNEGTVTLGDVRFLPDGTMLQIRRQVRQGVPFAERSRYKVDGGSMTFTMDVLRGEGPGMEMVKGTMKKVEKGSPHAVEATTSMAPADSAMARLLKCAGNYETKGGMLMEPAAKETPLTGTETVTGIFGNTVLQAITKGKAESMPGEHEGRCFMAWDPDLACYTQAWVDNLGMIGVMSCHFAADGKSLIATGTAVEQGQPVATRFVMELDEHGMLKRNTGWSLVGTAPPFRCFTLDYTQKR